MMATIGVEYQVSTFAKVVAEDLSLVVVVEKNKVD